MKDSVLAVIPARGGSKRCPNKNVKLFRGQPLFAWSVHQARKSVLVDRVVVSTENQTVRDICNLLAVEVINRPPKLATDTATLDDVVRHALGVRPAQWVVLLQPTSPLRLVADIDACILKAKKEGDGCKSFREDTGGLNGAVYVCRSEYLLSGGSFNDVFREFHVMPAERSADLDWPEEFALAE